MPKSPYTEKKERQEQREKMEAAVEQLQNDAGWKAWIQSHSSLSRFSFYNRLLVMLQVPEKRAKHSNADCMTRTRFQVAVQDAPYEVRTYNAWKTQGRQVKKGEKSLIVIKPVFGKVKVDENGKRVPADKLTGNETEVRMMVGFTGLKEFDITQTTGDLPERIKPQPIEGDSLWDVFVSLIEYAEDQGYTVNPHEIMDADMGGYVNEVKKHIGLNAERSVNQKCMTLIHEIAHTREFEAGKKINYENYSRKDAEIIVETATMMVGQYIGIDYSQKGLPYLASWKRPEDKDVFRRFAQAIDKIAKEIEDIIDEARKKEDESEILEPIAA